MRVTQRIHSVGLLIVAAFFAQCAGPTRIMAAPNNTGSGAFHPQNPPSTVDRKLYQHTLDPFMVACQISNRDFSDRVDPLSAAIPQDGATWSTHMVSEHVSRQANPVFWAATASPVQSVEFLFADKCNNQGRSRPSSFVSDYRTISAGWQWVWPECMYNEVSARNRTEISDVRTAWLGLNTSY